MSEWTAEIVTEPAADHELCVELLEDDQYRARIQWNVQHQLELRCYAECTIPGEWLTGIMERLRSETEHLHQQSDEPSRKRPIST